MRKNLIFLALVGAASGFLTQGSAAYPIFFAPSLHPLLFCRRKHSEFLATGGKSCFGYDIQEERKERVGLGVGKPAVLAQILVVIHFHNVYAPLTHVHARTYRALAGIWYA